MTTRIPSFLSGPANVSARVHQQDEDDDGPRQYIRRISAWDGQNIPALEAIIDEMIGQHVYVRRERHEHDIDVFHERYEVIDAANALLDRKDIPLYHRAAVYNILAYMSHHDPYFQLECLQSTHIYLDQLELRTRQFQEYVDNLETSIDAAYTRTRRELGIVIMAPGKQPIVKPDPRLDDRTPIVKPDPRLDEIPPFVKPDTRLDDRPARVRNEALTLFAALSKAISDVDSDSEHSQNDEEAEKVDSEKDIDQEKDVAEKMDAGPDSHPADGEDITMADVPAIVVQQDDGSSSASAFSGTAAIATASSSGPQEVSSAVPSASSIRNASTAPAPGGPTSSIPSDPEKDPGIQKGPRSPMPSFLRPHGASANAKLDTTAGVGHGIVRLSGLSPPSDSPQAGPPKAASEKNATQSLFNLLDPDSGSPTHSVGHEPVHSRYRKSASTKSKPSTTKSKKKQSQRPGGIDTLRHAFDPPEPTTAPPPVSPKFAAETPYDVPMRVRDSKHGGEDDKEDERMSG
ncbi:hypothetical protein PRZ48_003761 [Zasmidium cellare]|uniref:Uncharacterized protein n=1 Tax=Zasmidium cellare TaxID=395010 RepID=A0ABR0EXA9_ZASCE|nr:hypothetical protein PRZ48_003761 [Zasmidium cellare]